MFRNAILARKGRGVVVVSWLVCSKHAPPERAQNRIYFEKLWGRIKATHLTLRRRVSNNLYMVK